MKLFHGSTVGVTHPKILQKQRLLDFGSGFYTTSNQMQAERWAKIKQRRTGKDCKAVVTVYEISDDIFQNTSLAIKQFPAANEKWLDFIVANRKRQTNHPFDLVKGAVANDTLYETLTLYETGILSKSETIIRLRVHKLFDQISFHSAKALNELKFVDTYELP